MRKVLPTLMLRESFKNKLLKEPCYLPFSATRLRNYVIPQGVSSFNIVNIANGTLPKQVFFCDGSQSGHVACPQQKSF